MGTLWKKTIFVFVVIIVIFAIYLNFFMETEIVEEKTVDDGYEEIISLFEKNDVNYEKAKSLKFVYLDENNEEVIWWNEKENLINLKKDLQNFYTNTPGFEGQDANQLQRISLLYLEAIDFSMREEARLKELKSVMGKVNCENNLIQDANKIFSDRYVDIYSIQVDSEEFFYDFPTYFDPLEIDLDEEYNYWLLSQKIISDFEVNCEEIE